MGFLFENLTSDQIKNIYDDYSIALQRLDLITRSSTGELLNGKQMAFFYVHPECNRGLRSLGNSPSTQAMLNNYAVVSNSRPEGHPMIQLVNALKSGVIATMMEGEKGNWREGADNGGILNDPTRTFLKKAASIIGTMQTDKYTTAGQGLDPNEISGTLAAMAEKASQEAADMQNKPNASAKEISEKTSKANLATRVSADITAVTGLYDQSMLFGYQDPDVEERSPYASKVVPTAEEWEDLRDAEKWLYFFATNINAALGFKTNFSDDDATTLYYLVKEFENTIGNDANVKMFLDKLIEMNSGSMNVQGEDVSLQTSSSPGQLVAAMIAIPSIVLDKRNNVTVNLASKLAEYAASADPEHADAYNDAAKKINDFGNNVLNKAVFPGANLGKKGVREKLGSILNNVLALPKVKSSDVHSVETGVENESGFTPVLNILGQQAAAGNDSQLKDLFAKLEPAKSAIKILGRLFDNPGCVDDLGDDVSGGKENYIGADARTANKNRAALGTTPFASTKAVIDRITPYGANDWSLKADKDVSVMVIDPKTEPEHLKGAKAIPAMAIPLFNAEVKIKQSGDAQIDALLTTMVAAGLYVIMKETEGRLVNVPVTFKGTAPGLGKPVISQEDDGNSTATWPAYRAGGLDEGTVTKIIRAAEECFNKMVTVPVDAVTARNAWINVMKSGNPQAMMEQIYDHEVSDALRDKIISTKENPIADAIDIIWRHVLNVKQTSRNMTLSCGNIDMGAPMYTMNTDEHGTLRLTAGREGSVNKVGIELYRMLRGTVQRVHKDARGEVTYQLDMNGIPPFKISAENSDEWVSPVLVPIVDRDTDEISYCLLSGINMFTDFTEEGAGYAKGVNPDTITASDKSYQDTPTVFGAGLGGIKSVNDMGTTYDPRRTEKGGMFGVGTMTAGALRALGTLRSLDPKTAQTALDFFNDLTRLYRSCVTRADKMAKADPNNPAVANFDPDALFEMLDIRDIVKEYLASGRDANHLVDTLKSKLGDMVVTALSLSNDTSTGVRILAEIPEITGYVDAATDENDRVNREYAVLSGLTAMGEDGESCVGRHPFIVSFEDDAPRFSDASNGDAAATFGTRRREADAPVQSDNKMASDFENALSAAKECVANHDMQAVDAAYKGLIAAYKQNAMVTGRSAATLNPIINKVLSSDDSLNSAVAQVMPILARAYREAPELGDLDIARAFDAAFAYDDDSDEYASTGIARDVQQAHASAGKYDNVDALDSGEYDQFANVDPDVLQSMAGNHLDYETPMLDEVSQLDEDTEYSDYVGQFKGMPVLGYVKASNSAVHGDTLDVEKGFTPDDMVNLATALDDAHHFIEEHNLGVRLSNQKIRNRELQVHWAFDKIIDCFYEFFSADVAGDALDMFGKVKSDFDTAVKESAKAGVQSFLTNAQNQMNAFLNNFVSDDYNQEDPAAMLSDIATCFANVVMYIWNLDVFDRGFDETNSLGDYAAGGKDTGNTGFTARAFSATDPASAENTIISHTSSRGLDAANDKVVRQMQGSLTGANADTPEFTSALNNLYERARLGDTAGFENSIDKFGHLVKKAAEKSRLTKRSLYRGLNGTQLMSAFVDAIISDEDAGATNYPTVEDMVQSLQNDGSVSVPSYLVSRIKLDDDGTLGSATDPVDVSVSGSGEFSKRDDNTTPTPMTIAGIMRACGIKIARIPNGIMDFAKIVRLVTTKKYLEYGPFGKNEDAETKKMFMDIAAKSPGDAGFVPLDVIFAATTPHILNMAHHAAVDNAATTLQGMADKDTANRIARTAFGVNEDNSASNEPTGVTDAVADIIAAGQEYALAVKGMGGNRSAGDRIITHVGPNIGSATLTGILKATKDAKTPSAVKNRVDAYIKSLMRNMNGALHNALVTPARKNEYSKYQSASAAVRRTDYLADSEDLGDNKLFNMVEQILKKVSLGTDVSNDMQDEADTLGGYTFKFNGAEKMGALEEFQNSIRDFSKSISAFISSVQTYNLAQEVLANPADVDEDEAEEAKEAREANKPDPNAVTILTATSSGPSRQNAINSINKSISNFWRATGHDLSKKKPIAFTNEINAILYSSMRANLGVDEVISKVSALLARVASHEPKCYADKVPALVSDAQAYRGFGSEAVSRVDIDPILDLIASMTGLDWSVRRALDGTLLINGEGRKENERQAIMADAIDRFNKIMDKRNDEAGITDPEAREEANPHFNAKYEIEQVKKEHNLERLRLLDHLIVECSSLERPETLTSAGIAPYVAEELIRRGFTHKSTTVPNALTTYIDLTRGADNSFPSVCEGHFKFDITLSPYLTDIVSTCIRDMDITDRQKPVWDALSQEMAKYTTSANRERAADLPDEVRNMLTPFMDKVSKEMKSSIKSDMKAAVRNGTIDANTGLPLNTPVTIASGLVVTKPE